MRFKAFLFLIFLLSSIICEEDYYKILGIKRTANEQEIKRAFKKLSLKFHPDKNRDNAEKAKDQFAKIVNAYETLKDPEQRQVYDAKGEEGVRQHAANKAQQEQFQNGAGGFPGGFRFQQGGGNFEDMFSNFFGGGGGGGGGFHFNFGGGGGQRQQQEQKPESFFENSDVYEINMASLSRFFRRSDVWLVFCYRPEEKESKDVKDVIREVAEKYFGIFKVAAVNCAAEQELCEDEFQIFETPRVIAYTSALNHEGMLFKGDLKNAQMLANFAVSYMESFVAFLSPDNFQEFVNSEPDKHKILLFTAKKATPPLFKALSKDLKGKLVFGEVRQNNQELLDRFKIKNIPSLMVLTDPDRNEGVLYEGAYKKDAIMKFLREYAYTSAKKKKADRGEIMEVTRKSLQESQKCGGSDANLCLLMIMPDVINSENMNLLKGLANSYSDDPIHFCYIKKSSLNYAELFGGDVDEIPSVVIIRGKRMRFTRMEGEFTNDKIKDFVDQTLGGSSTFKKMNDTLENALVGGQKGEL